MKRHWRKGLLVLFALPLIGLIGCTQNQTTEAPPPALQSENVGEKLAKAMITIEAAGYSVISETDGWSDHLISKAVFLDWDEEIKLMPADKSNFALEHVMIERVPITQTGQEFLAARKECTVTASDESEIVLTHTPYGGIWDLPIRYDQSILTGYHIDVSANGEQQNYYFVIQSGFPTLDNSMYLRQTLQTALENSNLLRNLQTEGDINGDGINESIMAAITSDRMPFLAIDGNVVLCWARNDPSFYEYADLLAIDIDDDRQDEIVVLHNNIGTFGIQCADWKDGAWFECFLPSQEFSLTLEDNFRVQLICPGGAMQTISAAPDSEFYETFNIYFNSSGMPYSKEAVVTYYLESSDCTVDADGIHIVALLDMCADSGSSDDLGTDYTTTVLSVPVAVSIQNKVLLMECSQAVPAS